MDKAAAWLKKSLDFEFNDERLLRQALTHRSASGPNNERLEFLGDAVLQVTISEVVFRSRPNASEGQLSRLRSSLVKDVTLAEVAADLGVGEHLILGPGEKKSGGHRRSSILADTMEALFGAVFIDRGIDAAKTVIKTAFGVRLDDLPNEEDLRDPKTRLQELLQSQSLPLPLYELVKTSGKAHKQTFDVSCSITELQQKSAGRGLTRRDAEQDAARTMLALIKDRPA